MDRGTRIFWSILALLLLAAAFFGVKGEQARRRVQHAAAGLATGDLVTLVAVVGVDHVVVKTAAGAEHGVHLVGVRASDLDAPAKRGLEHALSGKPIRVLVGTSAKDRDGRTFATLFVDDEDVALRLVGRGELLVYTTYPFPEMRRYLDAQAAARTARIGIWADPTSAARAEKLLTSWRTESP